MLVTANMGLVAWNLLTDDFNHQVLTENWEKVDQHNHAAGKGVQVPTAGIELKAITQPLLAEESVGEKQLKEKAVGIKQLQEESVGEAQLTAAMRAKLPAATAVYQPGDLRFTAKASLDTGWLKCEGQAVSRTTYAALFAAIGTAYGEGDKSTTFNVPNYVEIVPMGAGSTHVLGKTTGEAEVKLTLGQIPSHNHGGSTGTSSTAATSTGAGTTSTESGYHEHGVGLENIVNVAGSGTEFHIIEGSGVTFPLRYSNSGTGVQNQLHTHTAGPLSIPELPIPALSISSAGSSQTHNNIQPSTTCNVWIKY